VQGDLLPAVIAATGGGGLVAGLYAVEQHQRAAMRASRSRFVLRFPMDAPTDGAQAALRALSGLSHPSELVFETAASGDGIKFYVYIAAASVESVIAALTSSLPGLRADASEGKAGGRAVSLAVTFPVPAVLATEAVEASGRALLGGLARLRDDELVWVRWAVSPECAPTWQTAERGDGSARQLQREWRAKTASTGFRVVGQVLASSPESGRARELVQHVAAILRSRQRLGRSVRTRGQGLRRASLLPRVGARSGWVSVPELLGVLAWPLGDEVAPGVEVGVARELLVPAGVARTGRRLFIGRDAHGPRPVALSFEAARHHMLVTGPTGVGKSVLLANCILDDIASGYGGAVLDPKSDLVTTVLDRLRPEDADRVVVLDPLAEGAVVGLDIFGSTGDPDLRTDALVGALARTFGEHWTTRAELYGRLALRTLSEVPGASMLDVGRLFTDDGFRRQALEQVHDRLLLGQWAAYEALSAAERAQHVQAPMARLSTLLSRPALRAVLAQPGPKLDLGAHFDARKWVFISLAPGEIGEAASRLLGSIAMYAVWNALERRVRQPEPERVPFALYVDELASLASLPFSFELLAERIRGFNGALTVAAQSLDRVDERVRNSLLGNVATLVTFRAGATEAARLARELPRLRPQDLQGLGRFEVAARIGVGTGSQIATATGHTQPLPPVTGTAAEVRRLSAERYGTPRADLEALWHAPSPSPVDAPIGRGRRRP
jgi:hypothetical protein